MEQVSFKVSLTEKDQESKSQVRRFEVPQDCSTSYIYLKEKLRSLFGQELRNSGINITWQDQDDDIVTVETDEELIIAMQEMKGPVYKFNISKASSGNESNEQERHHKAGELHPRVICDGCQGQVSGFRYKCMTCFDYDLCETCESQGIHPGHNMMRIATPESTLPRHFINRLNKMQNRTSKSNEESRNQGDTCRWPRGTGCPRDFGRGTGCPRGFGKGIKRGGCKVVPPPFCWIANQQYCNSANSKAKNSEESNFKRSRTDESYGARSPMNDLHGEVMKATEEAVRAALESTKLDSKDSKDSDSKTDSTHNSESANAMNDLNNFGEVMRGVLSSLGIELDVETKKNSDSNHQNFKGDSKDSENKENSEDSNQAGQEQEKDSEKSETGTKPRTIPILEENRQTNENSSEVQGVTETNSAEKQGVPEAMEETEMPLSPKIKVALQAMENMGFNNDNGWLSDLLMKYDGDIGKVLDLINKRN